MVTIQVSRYMTALHPAILPNDGYSGLSADVLVDNETDLCDEKSDLCGDAPSRTTVEVVSTFSGLGKIRGYPPCKAASAAWAGLCLWSWPRQFLY